MENAPTLAGDGLRTGREVVTRGVCVCVCLYMSVYVPSCVRLLCACLYVSVYICVHVYINEHLSLHSLHATPGRQSEEQVTLHCVTACGTALFQVLATSGCNSVNCVSQSESRI